MMEESLIKFMAESAKRHDEYSYLIKKIRASTDAAIRNQGASIKALEIQIGKISKIKLSQISVLFPGRLKEYDEEEVLKGLKKLQVNSAESATNLKKLLKENTRIEEEIKATMNEHYSEIIKDDLPLKKKDPRSLGKLAPIKLIIELADKTVKRPKGMSKNVLVGIDRFSFLVDFIVLDMPDDIKIPLVLGRLFLSIAHAKIDVQKKLAIETGLDFSDQIILLENIYQQIDVSPGSRALNWFCSQDLMIKNYNQIFPKDQARCNARVWARLVALRVGNEKIVFKSDNPTRYHENEDLVPLIKEREIVDEPMVDAVKIMYDDIVEKTDEYPSFCDYDRKIHVNCAYNLQFSCMIGYEHVNANFFLVLSINVMSKFFYNSIMKDKIEYKWKNVIGAFINVHIFVGNFSVVTNFAVVENMDAYRDKDMGDIIFGKPFYRVAVVEARRFDGFITIGDGNDSVTYQMACSHPRFKHLSKEQCNKIRPLLQVSAHDKLEGNLHSYQKIKGFYKGVLNLGPKYTREEKIVERLTRGHVSVHEME
ncbi:homeodomain-like protein [Tanacetum coccineum]